MKKQPILFVKACHLLIFSVLFLLSPTSYAANLDKTLDHLIQQTLPHATVGVYIQNLDGTPVYAHLADNFLYPASNIKLYTAAAALYSLGPDYHYNTSVSGEGDDVYIKFSGAPDLVPQDLNNLLAHVSTIKGRLILDTTQFKAPFYAGGSSYDDIGWYYTAPSHAVILNKNTVTYVFDTPKTSDKLIQRPSQQKENVLTLINDVKAVDEFTGKEHCTFNMAIKPHNILHLFGCFERQDHPISLSFGIPDPVFFAKQVIQHKLQEGNIQFNGKITLGKTPSTATPIATHPSASLAHLLSYMMNESDNLYADSITRTMGYKLSHEGTTKQGVYAIKKILAEKASMNMDHMELFDGIGTRYNLSSPRHIATLLSHVYQDPKIGSLFLGSLPIMGISGSLKERMKGSSLENKVFAKTGTMHDVSALSGFIKTAQGKILIFSIIINGVSPDLHKAKQLEEKILAQVWEAYPLVVESKTKQVM